MDHPSTHTRKSPTSQRISNTNAENDEIPPGTLFKRFFFSLSPTKQAHIESNPVLCIEGDSLAVDTRAASKLVDPTSKQMCQAFVGEMRKRYSDYTKTSTDPKKKARITGFRQPNFESERAAFTCKTPRWKDVAPKVNLITVPYGTCVGDKLMLFDTQENEKSKDYVEIEEGAIEGQLMPYQAPNSDFKLLAVDGSGPTTGGTPSHQHGIRLAIHLQKCTDKRCKFMGCADKSCNNIFKCDGEALSKYLDFYNAARRCAIEKFVDQHK